MALRPRDRETVGNDAVLDQRINDIISGNTFTQLQDYHRVDFSTKIANREDRQFTESVVQAIFDLERKNDHLKVDMSARLGTTILVWAEGLAGDIDLNYFAKIMNLPHPVSNFKGIGKVYVAPHKPGNPERLVVEVNSCVGHEQAGDITRLLEDRDRSGADRRHRGRQRYNSPPRLTQGRDRDRSPQRRSRSPSPRRSQRNRHHYSSRSSSSSESSDSDQGLLSRVISLVT